MVTGFDHMTLLGTDLDGAKRFFGLLGFKESASVVVSGDTMSKYMGIAEWQAPHDACAEPCRSSSRGPAAPLPSPNGPRRSSTISVSRSIDSTKPLPG